MLTSLLLFPTTFVGGVTLPAAPAESRVRVFRSAPEAGPVIGDIQTRSPARAWGLENLPTEAGFFVVPGDVAGAMRELVARGEWGCPDGQQFFTPAPMVERVSPALEYVAG